MVTDEDIFRDQRERDGLSKAILDAEAAVAVSEPGTRRTLQNFVDQAKSRVALLDKRIGDAVKEREVQAQERAVAIAALTAKETALSAGERETYRGFLAKDFFTKADFKQLDQFYSRSYDRLSEGGKEEVNKRVEEGIIRGEYKAGDLPESVQKRIAEPRHLSSSRTKEIERSSSTEVPDVKSLQGREGTKQAAMTPNAEADQKIDLSSIDLKGVKLVAATSQLTAASIPKAAGPCSSGRA